MLPLLGFAVVAAIVAALVVVRLRWQAVVDSGWATLASKVPWTDVPFDPVTLAALPSAARQFLSFAIAPGTPLRTVAIVAHRRGHGALAVRCFTVIAAPWGALRRGYRGALSTVDGIVIEQSIDQRWLFGLVPLGSAGGPAAADFARMAIAATLWTPAALLRAEVQWEGGTASTARFRMSWLKLAATVEIEVEEAGRLVAARIIEGALAVVARPSTFRKFGGYQLPAAVMLEEPAGTTPIDLDGVRFAEPWMGHSHS